MEDVVRIKVVSDMKQLEQDLLKITKNIDQMAKHLDDVGKGINSVLRKDIKKLESNFKSVNKVLEDTSVKTKAIKGDMNFLGLGFLGMQIQRTFQGILTSGVETFLGLAAGTSLVTDSMAALTANFNYFKFLLGSTVLEALEPFIKIGTQLLTWFSNLDDGTKTSIATFMLVFTVIGFLMSQLGFLVIGFQSLLAVLGVSAGAGVAGALIGVVVALVAVSFAITVLLGDISQMDKRFESWKKSVEDGIDTTELDNLIKKNKEVYDSMSWLTKGWMSLYNGAAYAIIQILHSYDEFALAFKFGWKAVLFEILNLIFDFAGEAVRVALTPFYALAGVLDAIGASDWANQLRGALDSAVDGIKNVPEIVASWGGDLKNYQKELDKLNATQLIEDFIKFGHLLVDFKYPLLSEEMGMAQLKKDLEEATKILGIDYDTVQKKLALVEESNKKAATNLANATVPVTMFDANGNMIGTTFNGATIYFDKVDIESLEGVKAKSVTPNEDFDKYYSSLGLPSQQESKTTVNNSIYINNVDSTKPLTALFGDDGAGLFEALQKTFDNKFGSNGINPN